MAPTPFLVQPWPTFDIHTAQASLHHPFLQAITIEAIFRLPTKLFHSTAIICGSLIQEHLSRSRWQAHALSLSTSFDPDLANCSFLTFVDCDLSILFISTLTQQTNSSTAPITKGRPLALVWVVCGRTFSPSHSHYLYLLPCSMVLGLFPSPLFPFLLTINTHSRCFLVLWPGHTTPFLTVSIHNSTSYHHRLPIHTSSVTDQTTIFTQ